MSITLYPHNAAAYEAAVSMLRDTGKAAVIHPTGTGKSFIGFKLCEDNSDKTVCWLSPSETIFRTQLENLRKTASPAASAPSSLNFSNIVFLTYARLMLMTPDELAGIRPDYIILDEFHRCGAEMWGAGVQRLLAAYPDAAVLGLSATNIRYLDNRRDMADELFDGNIASQMSLGEAIVCQNQLAKYENRVRRARSRAVRDEGEAILQALRRALEQAEGLDLVFDKHMADRTGKYLVFCSDAEHMHGMLAKVPEWFRLVDPDPHVYTAYSEDPETDRSFAAFKADDSAHLKLLFCIDMLNEGVHIPDVSGVILLRPTVSPIIYKQQIGRALSAGAAPAAPPVIFDIVLNIENLTSIDAIEDEMRLAAAWYRSLDLEDKIVNEHFRVYDEVRDCLELFDRLNDTLSASWDLMYREAKKYRSENGDLDVPQRYVTPDGYSLGRWLDTQRQVRAGKTRGTLTDNQIRLLDSLGMRWESACDRSFDRFFEAAEAYYRQNGNLDVTTRYVTPDGLKLGSWLANLRFYRKSGIKTAYLTDDRIRALDRIGMRWDVPDYLFERNYAAASEYHRRHGDLNVPTNYVSSDGLRLGVWIANLRTHYRKQELTLTPDQIRRLDELGMLWGGKYQNDWTLAFEEARCYRRTHGNLEVPVKYRTPSGMNLGRWVTRQRDFCKAGRLSEDRRQKLDSLGMVW